MPVFSSGLCNKVFFSLRTAGYGYSNDLVDTIRHMFVYRLYFHHFIFVLNAELTEKVPQGSSKSQNSGIIKKFVVPFYLLCCFFLRSFVFLTWK
jgi:hypothetical protein